MTDEGPLDEARIRELKLLYFRQLRLFLSKRVFSTTDYTIHSLSPYLNRLSELFGLKRILTSQISNDFAVVEGVLVAKTARGEQFMQYYRELELEYELIS